MIGPVPPLRPAQPAVEDADLWNRVVAAAGALPLSDDALHDAVRSHAVSGLCARIGGDDRIRMLAAYAEADEDADGWAGARNHVCRLGWRDPAALVVCFLISERTTSCAARSRYAQALAEVAARRFGTVSSSGCDPAVEDLLGKHEEAFARFLEAQRELTAELLDGRDEVILHRAIRTTNRVETAERDPELRPLSSFSTCPAYALSLAEHGCDASSHGQVVLYSALVPSTRILATPATGAAAVLEREVVLAIGERADRVTVTLPEPAS